MPIGVLSARRWQDALGDVLIVVPSGDTGTASLFDGQFEISECADAQLGIGHSIAHGVAARPDATSWLIGLADMPFIAPQTIRQVAARIRDQTTIVRPRYHGRAGHPVGFGAAYRSELLRLTGDAGAQCVINAHLGSLILMDGEDEGVVIDIDRPEDLAGS